jgi:hypothetical protein
VLNTLDGEGSEVGFKLMIYLDWKLLSRKHEMRQLDTLTVLARVQGYASSSILIMFLLFFPSLPGPRFRKTLNVKSSCVLHSVVAGPFCLTFLIIICGSYTTIKAKGCKVIHQLMDGSIVANEESWPLIS